MLEQSVLDNLQEVRELLKSKSATGQKIILHTRAMDAIWKPFTQSIGHKILQQSRPMGIVSSQQAAMPAIARVNSKCQCSTQSELIMQLIPLLTNGQLTTMDKERLFELLTRIAEALERIDENIDDLNINPPAGDAIFRNYRRNRG